MHTGRSSLLPGAKEHRRRRTSPLLELLYQHAVLLRARCGASGWP
jgi:hypothetical protein